MSVKECSGIMENHRAILDFSSVLLWHWFVFWLCLLYLVSLRGEDVKVLGRWLCKL